MENSLWTFGCSFTAEYQPLDNDPPNNYDLYKKYRGGELPSVWANLLSQKLNLNYKNKGYGARSNYTIFYTFCDWCSKIKKGDTVIVQWTSPYRFLMAHEEQYLQDVLPSCNYEEDFDMKVIETILVNRTNPIWISELTYFTKIINELCKQKEANVFYWTYHEDLIWSYMSSTWDEYNGHQIIQAPDNQSIMDYLGSETNYKQTIIAETNEIVEDVHLGELGHKAQAEYFYNYIKNQI
jgi:hypothetical protein